MMLRPRPAFAFIYTLAVNYRECKPTVVNLHHNANQHA